MQETCDTVLGDPDFVCTDLFAAQKHIGSAGHPVGVDAGWS